VDVATLPDLLDNSLPSRSETIDHHQHDLGRTNLQKNNSSPYPKSEWCQALIQYLHTAGFRGVMGRSWAEILQQIRQQSVDLLLIYLSDLAAHSSLLAALKDLSQLHNLPPVLVLDQHLSQSETRQPFYQQLEELATKPISEVGVPNSVTSQRSARQFDGSRYNGGNPNARTLNAGKPGSGDWLRNALPSQRREPPEVPSGGSLRSDFSPHATGSGENSGSCFELAQLGSIDLQAVLGATTAKVLPSSLSMAELLTAIKQSLATHRRQNVNTVIE
ncbi:MAG: hypothetical protein JOZ78_15135, partial [Chroococcidiopsidaceae cyanobacterium CP_BM_ER_R8_30]|nr:hypothetical protein [Chroococcidiopsidaceae cyanobacterium CP_BM_ER_R8_30]